MLTILLDLNYTLVGNSQSKRSPFMRQIEQETYRPELVALVRPHRVFLITARPRKYQDVTLARIEELTGWRPKASFFKKKQAMMPHIFKGQVVAHLVDQGYITATDFSEGRVLAIESNPRTRKVYAGLGIPCLNVSENKDGTPA